MATGRRYGNWKILCHSARIPYGIENGIRCFHCHKFALLHQEECSLLRDKDSRETGDYQYCYKQNVRNFSWGKVDLRNDPDLPSESCGSCYITRCYCLEDDAPIDAQSKTILGWAMPLMPLLLDCQRSTVRLRHCLTCRRALTRERARLESAAGLDATPTTKRAKFRARQVSESSRKDRIKTQQVWRRLAVNVLVDGAVADSPAVLATNRYLQVVKTSDKDPL